MTKDEDFKALVRARMGKTGESYTAARRQILAENPSWTSATAGDLAERVDDLEGKVAQLLEVVRELESRVDDVEDQMEDIDETGWDPPAGVSRYRGELMFLCPQCNSQARGFASQDSAAQALERHYRDRGHGPLLRSRELGTETLVARAQDADGE